MIAARTLLIGGVLLGALTAVGCSDSDDDGPAEEVDTSADGGVAPDGLRVADSRVNVADAIMAIESAITDNPAARVVTIVDHEDAAAMREAGPLRPTRVILFGNPNLGTPLMQANRTLGLDLPQKILAWETDEGETQLAWNTPSWLARRHGIEDDEAAGDVLGTIGEVLETLATNAAGQAPEAADLTGPTVAAGDGLEVLESTRDFDTTYAALEEAITAAGPLGIVARLDHAANAANAELELPPTKLIVFGNPSLGSGLMAERQTAGIDLPQKMLVYEEEGGVSIAWNDPAYVAERHGIVGEDDAVEAIAAALLGLARTAAGTDGEGGR